MTCPSTVLRTAAVAAAGPRCGLPVDAAADRPPTLPRAGVPVNIAWARDQLEAIRAALRSGARLQSVLDAGLLDPGLD